MTGSLGLVAGVGNLPMDLPGKGAGDFNLTRHSTQPLARYSPNF
jgi:hypothetical protein